MTKEPELIPIHPSDTFSFACNPNVPCFNQCCKDLNQALTPYDVLRLKNHLNLTARSFLEKYAVICDGPTTGLPVVSLRFSADADKNCPFVTPDGCTVYEARPSSCRTYPLARALRRSRADGAVTEHYALLKEPHCRGFDENDEQTTHQWVSSQELETYYEFNDLLMELIAMKNQLRPGALSPEHQHLTRMAFYDLDTLKEKALAGELQNMNPEHLKALPAKDDDMAWLSWSMSWIAQVLFGKNIPRQD